MSDAKRRRLTLLTLFPGAGRVPTDPATTPVVLMSTRLTEIRAFSDLFSEFRASLEESGLPLNTKLLVLCNRPSYEFVAFQARQ